MATARSIPEIVYYTGDARPVITGTLYQSNGAVFDLTGSASVDLFLYLEGATTGVFTGSQTNASFTADKTLGQVTYTIPSVLTDPGSYIAQFQITWSGGAKQHTSKFRLRVEQGLS